MTEKSQELEPTKPAVPALAQTPALAELTAEDVALPRLYIGQFMSAHVQEDRVEPGVLFTSLGEDDPDPQTLWSPGDKGGVVVYVIDLKKGKSVTSDGELVMFDYNDPDAPPDAWVTYNYIVAIPDADEDVPFKWLLTRTGQPAAKQINLVLAKNASKGAPFLQAFEVTTAPRENKKGKYFVPRVRPVEATEEGVKVAEQLAVMVSGQRAEYESTSEEPAI